MTADDEVRFKVCVFQLLLLLYCCADDWSFAHTPAVHLHYDCMKMDND